MNKHQDYISINRVRIKTEIYNKFFYNFIKCQKTDDKKYNEEIIKILGLKKENKTSLKENEIFYVICYEECETCFNLMFCNSKRKKLLFDFNYKRNYLGYAIIGNKKSIFNNSIYKSVMFKNNNGREALSYLKYYLYKEKLKQEAENDNRN